VADIFALKLFVAHNVCTIMSKFNECMGVTDFWTKQT